MSGRSSKNGKSGRSNSSSRRLRWRVLAPALAGSLVAVGGPTLPAVAADGGGPALTSATAKAASSAAGHSAAALDDGDRDTYWQSDRGAFPAWAQIDLGARTKIDRAVLKLPEGFGSRKQTLAVQGSADGTAFRVLVPSETYAFTEGDGNTVTIRFPALDTRYLRVEITGNSVAGAGQLAELEAHRADGGSGDLARGKRLRASSSAAGHTAPGAADADRDTYWQSGRADSAPWIETDLGAAVAVNRVVMRLPGGFDARTQSLKVQGSTDGMHRTDLVAATTYEFSPETGNRATISFDTTTTRHLRLALTGASKQSGGRLGELEVYGPATGDSAPPSAPGALKLSRPESGKVALDWRAARDDTKVTGYDVYLGGVLRTTVAGNVTSYTDHQPADRTLSYRVTARDAAGNQSAASNTVTREAAEGDTQAPTPPTGLTVQAATSGEVKVSWQKSSDDEKVTGYDIHADNRRIASVAGNVTSFTDERPAGATVTYRVRAKDAAGNTSPPSTEAATTGDAGSLATNLAVGKPVVESGHVHTFVGTNAVDNNVGTYWEGASGVWPSTLTVRLGANADISQVVIKLNPDPVWGARTQNIQILGREQNATGYTTLVQAADRGFSPSTGNTVTIPVTARTADVQVRINSNTGAPGGQIGELQVIGDPAPNPDLTVTGLTASPASPVETDPVSLTARVANTGSAASPASEVAFYLGTTRVATANVGALAAGAATDVTTSIGTRDAGSYQLTARVDEANTVVEQNDTNNSFTAAGALVVRPVDSADLVASPVGWSPDNPAAGSTVNFSITLKNQGTVASAGGAHPVTLTVLNESGGTVRTLTGTYTGSLAAGATSGPIALGSWTAVNGKYTVRTVIADDANELPVKRANNSSTTPLFVGRGANLPYTAYEAEDGVLGGGAQTVGPNRTVGDLAGEASGRRAVTLNNTGNYVEWTTKEPTNTLVTRFSLPDSAGGGGIDSTLNVYVNGTFHKAINLTSKYSWLYGAEASPSNSPGAGPPRHIYDEANVMLDSTVPAGARIRLQKDAANTSRYAIDFINTERVAQIANPDPARYTTPSGFTQQDVQNALDRVRMDTTGTLIGVYLPAGTYQTSSKFHVYGKAVRVVGAGPWYSRFAAPAAQSNTDVGFRIESSANGSTFANFSYFGNYDSRNDGPGKVFGDLSNVSNLTLDNLWVEHQMCLYWAANSDNVTIKNSRIRDTFADAINMTNGSQNNLVQNNEARSTGDDSFALFAATDNGGGNNTGNVYENLTSTLTWRAAGIAVYGGENNVFRNLYIADTLVYSGITISSLDFGYPMNGFGPGRTTVENASLVRAGGHFWGSQTFGAIWMFSASRTFTAIRVTDVDIVDPTYSGIMFQTNYVGGQPQNRVQDTVLTDVSITGARKSGDAYDAKSGFGIWANELPEPGQGPAVGSATFIGLHLENNAVDIRNTTSTFTVNVQ
ncbi:discoidin domain-containing protein [Streptomyces sp. NPDC088789]|uniref:discoidin domain-containing protein n=1 Tax=Streptomyces sp. NPDC088789 TaxID=3365899 RepID=UPI0038163C57